MRYSFLILLFFFNSKILFAACPSGDDGQTVNILSGDSCTTRISNPQSTINVAGSLIVNSGDGAIYFNTGSHDLTITGTVQNTNTGTSHGIRDVATNVTSVTISGNGSVTGNVAGYYNEGSDVSLTTNQSNLVFKGKVPNTYEILIESSSDFGKTFFTPADISGTLGFSIGSDSSISTAGTYSSVLNNITSDKIFWIIYRSINMSFCCKIEDAIRFIFKDYFMKFFISNISFYKSIVFIVFKILNIIKI